MAPSCIVHAVHSSERLLTAPGKGGAGEEEFGQYSVTRDERICAGAVCAELWDWKSPGEQTHHHCPSAAEGARAQRGMQELSWL